MTKDSLYPHMSRTTRYSAEAFHSSTDYELRAGAYGWLPGDRQVLISSNETGVFNVHALDVETGETSPLTHSTTQSHFFVSAFPEDERILFTADQGGDELNHLFVRESSGEVRDLTPGNRLKAVFAGWSRDGSHFFVTTNARDQESFDLYRYGTDDYAAELVFRNEERFAIHAVADRYVALVKEHTNANADIYLLDWQADDPGPQLITPHDGDIEYAVFGFTRDDRQLVFRTNEHGEYAQAWTYDVASGDKAPLVQANWDVDRIFYSLSGRYRVTAINEDARTTVDVVDTRDGNRVSMPSLPRGEIMAVCFSRSETRAALLIDTDTSPADIYVIDFESDRPARRLTRALTDVIDETDLVGAEVVRYASYDRLEVPGVLYRPRDASPDSPCPAMVFVHGGPGGQSCCGYNPVFQHIVNHGCAVFAANNRGSSGYGKTFFHMADRRHGEADLDDIVEARRFLAGLPWVDGERIGVMGGSYGGYMVGAALAFRPGVFNIGIDVFGVMNWVRTLKEIPPWWGQMRDALYSMMGDPATDEDRLTRISPLFHASNINVPLLVIQGANDPRVLKVESDEIVEAVRVNGVPVEYVVFDDEGHGFTKRVNRIRASEAYVRFIEKHL